METAEDKDQILFTEPTENTHFLGNLLLIVSAFVTFSQKIPIRGNFWLIQDKETASNLRVLVYLKFICYD